MFSNPKTFKKLSYLLLGLFLHSSWAITVPHEKLEPLLDGYYPPYPKVTIKDPSKAAQISRGEYLAKMGDCIACHTNTKL
ncbi:MAG TPA: hypothetical protein DCZ80_02545, partial [Legionellales bacterium]|nr:hypothetical protein [Legionellales bacterium]